MNASLYTVRGTRLYVEQYHEEAREALLYLHGGPGASCLDFGYHQAQALSRKLRVIAVDQRGVLRSDPIPADESFGLYDIVEDMEDLRTQLGIPKWSLLGHSFGGYVAVLYALKYPHSVDKIIFEAPTFDLGRSTKAIVAKAQSHCVRSRNQPGEALCTTYLNGSYSAAELWTGLGELFQLLGEDKDLIYFHGMTTEAYRKITQSRAIPGEAWNNSGIHNQKLQEEGLFFESLLPRLAELTQPTLLLAGVYDPVCCQEQQQAYLKQVPNSRMVRFDGSAHFPRLEEPEKYTEEVLRFIAGRAGT